MLMSGYKIEAIVAAQEAEQHYGANMSRFRKSKVMEPSLQLQLKNVPKGNLDISQDIKPVSTTTKARSKGTRTSLATPKRRSRSSSHVGNSSSSKGGKKNASTGGSKNTSTGGNKTAAAP